MIKYIKIKNLKGKICEKEILMIKFMKLWELNDKVCENKT